MGEGLNPRQREFCERYLLTSNAAASARAAGYAEGTARDAYRMLRRPEVAAYLARRGRELIDERVNPRRVLLELAAVAFADITDYAVVEDGRVRVLDSPGGDEGGWGKKRWGVCVQSLKQGAQGAEVRLHDKMRALEALSKMMRMYDAQAQEEVARQARRLELRVE